MTGVKILRAWKRRRLRKAVGRGEISINEARQRLGLPPWEDLGLDEVITWTGHP